MIESDLYAKLAPLVGNRVYPDVAPEGTVKPFITYQQKGGSPVNFLGPESSDKKNARFQINVWSVTRIEASILMRLIEDLMVTSPLFGKIEGGAIGTYDDVTKARGAMQDFSFWS